MTDREIAEWVVTTCLLNGTTVGTAYTVAGMFVDGLERERRAVGAPDA